MFLLLRIVGLASGAPWRRGILFGVPEEMPEELLEELLDGLRPLRM
jgi:hypothetical protein